MLPGSSPTHCCHCHLTQDRRSADMALAALKNKLYLGLELKVNRAFQAHQKEDTTAHHNLFVYVRASAARFWLRAAAHFALPPLLLLVAPGGEVQGAKKTGLTPLCLLACALQGRSGAGGDGRDAI